MSDVGFISPPFFEKSGDGAGSHFGGELPAGRRRGRTLAGTGKRGRFFVNQNFFSVNFTKMSFLKLMVVIFELGNIKITG